jgi:hypothetical protein
MLWGVLFLPGLPYCTWLNIYGGPLKGNIREIRVNPRTHVRENTDFEMIWLLGGFRSMQATPAISKVVLFKPVSASMPADTDKKQTLTRPNIVIECPPTPPIDRFYNRFTSAQAIMPSAYVEFIWHMLMFLHVCIIPYCYNLIKIVKHVWFGAHPRPCIVNERLHIVTISLRFNKNVWFGAHRRPFIVNECLKTNWHIYIYI